MLIEKQNLILVNIIRMLELPDQAYEKARDRYVDLGNWLSREDSKLKDGDPHVFPQGSFRLGTAIRPLFENEAYDLDLAWELRKDYSKDTITQEKLKMDAGEEIEAYRISRQIKAKPEAKHRCWRLVYQDDLSFHLDMVPCIPAERSQRKSIYNLMAAAGESDTLAREVSNLTVAITDDRHPRFRTICDDWKISNPEGYARWFETRIVLNNYKGISLHAAKVDPLHIYKKKTPLQRAIQLLKRHRDIMYRDNPESKPISIILTTLAARAYRGERVIESALKQILQRMGTFVSPVQPRVPNPVNPIEDFADRWSMPSYSHLQLEFNFFNWLKQAQKDFDLLVSMDDPAQISMMARHKLGLVLKKDSFAPRHSLSLNEKPKTHFITSPLKPWCEL